MKRTLIAIAIVAFVAAGAAQPAAAQQNDSDVQVPEELENETEELENESDAEMNMSEDQNNSDRAPQFDARLSTAIKTVSTLVEIAPNDDAREGLENAVDALRRVQSNTDTESLPSDKPEQAQNPGERGELDSENSTEDRDRKGPPEDKGPSGQNGPSENSNRPGFVSRMLGGLFG